MTEGKKILEIPIDAEDWFAFVASFQQYQKELSEQGNAWAETNSGIRQAGDAFEDLEGTFEKLSKGVTDPKFSSQSSGVFVRVSKEAEKTDRSWRSISRELEKSSRTFGNIARTGLSFNSLGIFGATVGAVGAVAGGIYAGVKGGADDLANQNILNRKLGLKPGEAKAFDTVFEKAGGDSDLLAKMATAKTNQSQWQYLQAAGITPQEIQSESPSELAAEFLQKAGARFKAMGPQGGQWAEAMGITRFADENQLRQAGSYGAGDYSDMLKQYTALVPKLAADQKILDDATATRQKIEADIGRVELDLEKAFLRFAPMVEDAADDFADLVDSIKPDEIDKAIKELTDDFKSVTAFVDKYIAPFLPKVTTAPKKMAPDDKAVIDFGGRLVDGFKQSSHDIHDFLYGPPQSKPSTPGTPESDDEKRLLDATRAVESSNGKNLTGPVTAEGWQARGPYQFSPADLKRYGVADPDNEQQERDAARRKYKDLEKKYGSNLHEREAAYNWGEGNVDKYLKKHGGVWDEQGLPDSVKSYLAKMDKAQATQQPAQQQASAFENAPTIEPYTADDERAKAASDAKEQANANPYMPVVHDPKAEAKADKDKWMADNAKLKAAIEQAKVFAMEGGGARYRSPDPQQPTRSTNANPVPYAPYNIHVTVTAPAGSNTSITSGGLPQ
ncbi:lytic transglycosylase domain-containing protein [Paraburkholderia sp. C35]|uniref:lytic transglycosylase domain-containing protein n=1 Tax=Paraburkholderia sp. C35 TaxID=2126993 RepID=UPI000D6984ED|nr:lytic transglycosylase domain-containing protein [Paraburkholderia sp. C35]